MNIRIFDKGGPPTGPPLNFRIFMGPPHKAPVHCQHRNSPTWRETPNAIPQYQQMDRKNSLGEREDLSRA